MAPTMTMMIIAGVRMVMAMGDKSGSNESGRWWCDSSWVFVVVMVSVVVLVRVDVVAFVVMVAVVKVMPLCLWWRRGYCSPLCLWWWRGNRSPPQPPAARVPQPLSSFSEPIPHAFVFVQPCSPRFLNPFAGRVVQVFQYHLPWTIC